MIFPRAFHSPLPPPPTPLCSFRFCRRSSSWGGVWKDRDGEQKQTVRQRLSDRGPSSCQKPLPKDRQTKGADTKGAVTLLIQTGNGARQSLGPSHKRVFKEQGSKNFQTFVACTTVVSQLPGVLQWRQWQNNADERPLASSHPLTRPQQNKARIKNKATDYSWWGHSRNSASMSRRNFTWKLINRWPLITSSKDFPTGLNARASPICMRAAERLHDVAKQWRLWRHRGEVRARHDCRNSAARPLVLSTKWKTGLWVSGGRLRRLKRNYLYIWKKHLKVIRAEMRHFTAQQWMEMCDKI